MNGVTYLHSLYVMSQQLKSADEFLKSCVVDEPLQWVKYSIIEVQKENQIWYTVFATMLLKLWCSDATKTNVHSRKEDLNSGVGQPMTT